MLKNIAVIEECEHTIRDKLHDGVLRWSKLIYLELVVDYNILDIIKRKVGVG